MIAILSTVCLSACSSLPDQHWVGADGDSHGCISSAGYTWSEARESCIRVWEEGIELEPYAKDGTRAYVVLSADGTLAEVFLSVKTKPILLKRSFSQDGPFWKGQSAPWLLKRLAHGWKLYNGSVPVYHAPNP